MIATNPRYSWMGWRTKVRSIIRVVTCRVVHNIIQHHYILRIFSYIFSHFSSNNDTIFYSFLSTAKHLLSGGKDHCVLGLQPRKWTDLQSAEGHKYDVHDVLWWCQSDRSETSLTKSRAAMAQWELEFQAHAHGLIVWDVFWSAAGQCSGLPSHCELSLCS